MPDAIPTAVPWSVAQHDTIPQVDLWLNPLDTHTYLFAFLNAEGERFEPPYEAVRSRIEELLEQIKSRERQGQAPSRDVKDQRIRTWRAIFERFGFIRIDDVQSIIELTPLGRALRGIYSDVDQRVQGANDHLATLGIAVLSRQTLFNPIDGQDYPKDSDIRPFRLIWKAMRSLDDRLHWQEINRVLMWINYSHEQDAAIDHIRQVRKSLTDGYDAKALAKLGKPAVEQGEETKRRITPWFARAGFGGLLITGEDDNLGFRHLIPAYKLLIDRALQEELPFPAAALVSRKSYLQYLTADAVVGAQEAKTEDAAIIQQVLSAVAKHALTKIICLSGLPATGKTRLAKLVAARLTENDPYRYDEIQFHETTTYEDFMEGFVPRPSGDGFELVRKTFREINRRARLDPAGRKYVLLIEEFTRTNVHAVLGELLTYIEHRDRPFRLLLSQEQERIAPNLIVLATMNPRDKSALVLDNAITRRLHRIPINSSADHLRAMLKDQLDAALIAQLADWFEHFEKDIPFGHGVFAGAKSADDLRDIWAGTVRYFLTDISGEVKESFRELDQKYPWQ